MLTGELAATQEELAAARAELERLQETAADSEARATHVESQLTQANEEIELARSESEAREQDLTAQLQSEADRYRGLALEQAPELPAELLSGAPVAEMDEALRRTRDPVSHVRGPRESSGPGAQGPGRTQTRSATSTYTTTARHLSVGRRAGRPARRRACGSQCHLRPLVQRDDNSVQSFDLVSHSHGVVRVELRLQPVKFGRLGDGQRLVPKEFRGE